MPKSPSFKLLAVYGPPGTGKTHFLAHELADRVDRYGESKTVETTAVISFTRAAASEIAARVSSKLAVMTLHALCYRLLGISTAQVVGNENLKEFSKLTGITFGFKNANSGEFSMGELEIGDRALGIYDYARAKRIPLIQACVERCEAYGPMQNIIEKYVKWKKANGYLDFTDMLTRCLDNHLIIPPYSVLFVDEAQDLSYLQLALLEQWIDDGAVDELILAGDDDQTLYPWAGADSEGMQRLTDKYHGKTKILSKSYRLPTSVFDLADYVVNGITKRVKKEFSPVTEKVGRVQEIQAWEIPHRVKADDDVLILYRTHYMRQEIERMLCREGLPYKCISGYPGRFDDRYARAAREWEELRRAEPGTNFKIPKFLKFQGENIERHFGESWDQVINMPYVSQSYLRQVSKDYGLDYTPKIKLSTIHGAKGKEAKTVILLNSINERIAGEMNSSIDGADDERRVFYVGVTRAIDNLYLVRGERPLPYLTGV